MRAVYENVGALDARAREAFFLSDDVLMEHAAAALCREVLAASAEDSTVLILSGPGNNGADGIACARLLQMHGVRVALAIPLGVKSPMSVLQLERALALGIRVVDEIAPADIVVDALFGSGLTRPIDGEIARILGMVNSWHARRIACDFPTGLFDDGHYDVAFESDVTVSMGALKQAYFYDTAKDLCGEIVHADLGLSHGRYTDTTDTFLLEASDMKLPIRTRHHSHKGTYGHVAVLEGAMPGAPTMTAKAALTFGAGLVSVVGYAQHDYPAMIMHATHIPPSASVLALGMGMGESYEDQDILEMCGELPLVIDADLFSNPLIVTLLEQKSPKVLTPHPKEFATLLNRLDGTDYSTDDIISEKFRFAREFSRRFPHTVLILKGTCTLIASDGIVRISSMGTPALAKGGSGDVLAGMVAALIAQGYEIFEAATSGVIAHSLCAVRYSGANYAFTPEALIKELEQLHLAE